VVQSDNATEPCSSPCSLPGQLQPPDTVTETFLATRPASDKTRISLVPVNLVWNNGCTKDNL
jgi:hypothetical protein